MKRDHKMIDGKPSRITAVPVGIAIAAIISLLLTIGLTSLTLNGSLDPGHIVIPLFFVRAISVLAGALVATAMHREKMLMTIWIVAGAYLALLLTVSVIEFDAGFSNLTGGVMSVITGGVMTCIIRLSAQNKPRYPRMRNM